MIAIAKDAISDTYLDFEELIELEARSFSYKHAQTDVEELISHGSEIFMRAYRTYEPSYGKFKTWLVFLLRKIWMEHMRRKAMRNSRLPREDLDLGLMAEHVPGFNYGEWLEELSDDAKLVAELVVHSPRDIVLYIRERGDDNPRNFRASVREYLRIMGWSTRRIRDSFSEIAEALCG